MTCLPLSSEDDTKHLAQRFADRYRSGSIWLNGDLGAGKTTFVRYFLQSLGHTDKVKSPTYTIVEPYHLGGVDIYHVDLYRICDSEELYAMGFFEYFSPKALLLIEWPSRGEALLPTADLVLDFKLEHGNRWLCFDDAAL